MSMFDTDSAELGGSAICISVVIHCDSGIVKIICS